VWAPGPAAPPDRAQLIEWELLVDADALDGVESNLRSAGYQPSREGKAVRLAEPWGTRVGVLPQSAKE
jgi:hypothetical protein